MRSKKVRCTCVKTSLKSWSNTTLLISIFQLATEMIKKSISLWLPKFKAADKGDVPDEEFDPLEVFLYIIDIIFGWEGTEFCWNRLHALIQ